MASCEIGANLLAVGVSDPVARLDLVGGWHVDRLPGPVDLEHAATHRAPGRVVTEQPITQL